jgi:hypothetical protein
LEAPLNAVDKDRTSAAIAATCLCLLLLCMNYKFHNNNAQFDKNTVTLLMMSRTNRPFFKGLPTFVAATDEMEVSKARDSVYYWWWAFARLSPVLWYSNHAGIKPIDPAIAKVADGLGDVWRNGSFGVWWKTRGSKVFAETKRPAKVQPLDLNLLHEHPFDAEKLYLEVPLNIRQQTIVSQFKKMLAEAHEGRGLNLAAHSTAEMALFTKRYRLPTLKREYWVLLYRLLYPNIEIWRIGDRLQVAPEHDVVSAAGSRQIKAKHALNSLTGRYYYKARFTVLNMERDSFPNYASVEVSSRKQPFGAAHQIAFRAATEDADDGSLCTWSQWLRQQYLDDLKHEVIERNDRKYSLRYNIRRPESNARHRIDAYIAGTSDLLA